MNQFFCNLATTTWALKHALPVIDYKTSVLKLPKISLKFVCTPSLSPLSPPSGVERVHPIMTFFRLQVYGKARKLQIKVIYERFSTPSTT